MKAAFKDLQPQCLEGRQVQDEVKEGDGAMVERHNEQAFPEEAAVLSAADCQKET